MQKHYAGVKNELALDEFLEESDEDADTEAAFLKLRPNCKRNFREVLYKEVKGSKLIKKKVIGSPINSAQSSMMETGGGSRSQHQAS